jgi:hypothetical protein
MFGLLSGAMGSDDFLNLWILKGLLFFVLFAPEVQESAGSPTSMGVTDLSICLSNHPLQFIVVETKNCFEMYVFHILPCCELENIEGILVFIWWTLARDNWTGLVHNYMGWRRNSHLKAHNQEYLCPFFLRNFEYKLNGFVSKLQMLSCDFNYSLRHG